MYIGQLNHCKRLITLKAIVGETSEYSFRVTKRAIGKCTSLD